MAELPGVLRLAVRALAHGHHMNKFNVPVGRRVGHHGLHQMTGLSHRVTNDHPVSGLDMPHRLVGAHLVRVIVLLPVHIALLLNCAAD
ncbi:hypothetical protein SDC9_144673 [bioreactor metagenome]|uniref:Uncharacterized protein n=1 Tax=bioreactor metagenome TaxID=1076179 RepID=A0A645E6R9_9ZZZZ